MVDAITAITILALAAALVHRLQHPVKKRISTPEDYLVWAVTFLPLLTGYLAYHRLINPYPLVLGLHILSVELLLVVFPFTKLTHAFTTFIARWYNGAIFGRKGVAS
jgi:nitrate reductase gamma subunit